MPKAATTGVLSVIVVVAWSSVYLSTHSPNSSKPIEDVNYEDSSTDGDYDLMFYPMDDTNVPQLNALIGQDAIEDSNLKPTLKFNETSSVFSTSPDTERTLATNSIWSSTPMASNKYDESTTTSGTVGNYDYRDKLHFVTTTATKSAENNTAHLVLMLKKNVTNAENQNYTSKVYIM